jgi:hypothetical protein
MVAHYGTSRFTVEEKLDDHDFNGPVRRALIFTTHLHTGQLRKKTTMEAMRTKPSQACFTMQWKTRVESQH